jgi:hypothetical protein
MQNLEILGGAPEINNLHDCIRGIEVVFPAHPNGPIKN